MLKPTLSHCDSAMNHNIMRIVVLITLFSSVSALVLQPLITPAPEIAIRDTAPNICGYYSLSGISMLNDALSIHSHG